MEILLFLEKNDKSHKNKKIEIYFENIVFYVFCIIYTIISLSGSVLIFSHTENINKHKKYTICLDAGHGGIDGGATGSFVKESDINLAVTQKLTKLFVAGGFNVVNTRTEDICLCDDIKSPSFKLDDMKKRRQIIQNCNPDILISVHCNKFHLSGCKGAQVFYQNNCKSGELLANIMTDYFVKNLPNAKNFSLSADYYVLNSTKCPAVLVECGFVSNIDEEKMLADNDYQQVLAYSIYAGTLKYLLIDLTDY